MYNNLTHTLSTLLVEANQPLQPPFDRQFIMGELGIAEAEVGGGGGRVSKVPLLYGMVAAMRGEVKEQREKEREEKSEVSGKEEAGAVTAAARVETADVSTRPQRSSVGTGVEEKIVRKFEPVQQPQPYQAPHHRTHFSS